jgi:hypothetical protein
MQSRPEAKLADPMLVGMAGGAQRNCIAIARFHPQTTIGSGPLMRASDGAALPQATQGS